MTHVVVKVRDVEKSLLLGTVRALSRLYPSLRVVSYQRLTMPNYNACQKCIIRQHPPNFAIYLSCFPVGIETAHARLGVDPAKLILICVCPHRLLLPIYALQYDPSLSILTCLALHHAYIVPCLGFRGKLSTFTVLVQPISTGSYDTRALFHLHNAHHLA